MENIQLRSIILVLLALSACAGPVSRPVTEVLRDPLPSEDLACTESDAAITVQGPTFRYVVDRATGAVSELQATRGGREVVRLCKRPRSGSTTPVWRCRPGAPPRY